MNDEIRDILNDPGLHFAGAGINSGAFCLPPRGEGVRQSRIRDHPPVLLSAERILPDSEILQVYFRKTAV